MAGPLLSCRGAGRALWSTAAGTVRGPRRCLLLVLAVLCGLVPRRCAASGAGDLYCGKENCYSVLDVSRDAAVGDVKKAFRKLALKCHPDKNRSRAATAEFRRIGRANDVLSDERLREAYDHYLDHPEDSYSNYYNYYHAVYTPKTPVWIVVLGMLVFLSGLQYINQQWRYSSMMRCVKYQPSFKRRVTERIDQELLSLKGAAKKTDREALRLRIEEQVLESEVQVSGGGFAPASWQSLVLVRAIRSPLDISLGLYRFGLWHWRFSWKQEPYGPEEREYLTQRVLGLSSAHWSHMGEEEREAFVARELWVADNLLAYRQEREEEMKERLAQSGAYRRARRWQRKNG